MLEPNAHYPTPPLRGYAKTAKWLFTLLMSKLALDSSPLFSDQIQDICSIGLKYLQRNKVSHFSLQLRLCKIIVTLEIKRITICLQMGMIKIK